MCTHTDRSPITILFYINLSSVRFSVCSNRLYKPRIVPKISFYSTGEERPLTLPVYDKTETSSRLLELNRTPLTDRRQTPQRPDESFIGTRRGPRLVSTSLGETPTVRLRLRVYKPTPDRHRRQKSLPDCTRLRVLPGTHPRTLGRQDEHDR